MTAITRSGPWRWPWPWWEVLLFCKVSFHIRSVAYIHINSSWKLLPQNLIQNLRGPPVSSVCISLTDSCSPHWGFRVKYPDRWRCCEAFLFTHRQGWKEQIYYWQLVNILWSCSVSSDISHGLFIFWVCCIKTILRALFQNDLSSISEMWTLTAGKHIRV